MTFVGTPESLEEETIGYYFKHGYTYPEIIDFLSTKNINMGIRTLKRRIKDLNLSRKKMKISEEELRSTTTNTVLEKKNSRNRKI